MNENTTIYLSSGLAFRSAEALKACMQATPRDKFISTHQVAGDVSKRILVAYSGTELHPAVYAPDTSIDEIFRDFGPDRKALNVTVLTWSEGMDGYTDWLDDEGEQLR